MADATSPHPPADPARAADGPGPPPAPCRLPPPLASGDTVALIAPAGPTPPEAWAEGRALLEARGLRVWAPEALSARQGYLAGSDAARAAALDAALDAPHVRALWAVRGGYGCTRLLPHVDGDKVARRGLWLVGCSDISALHRVWAQAGLASLHAANLTSLPRWSAAAQDALFAALCAPGGGPPRRLPGRFHGPPRAAAGPLWGGNLAVLTALCGTRWQPRFAGGVVLFEDVNEAPYRLDRLLTQMIAAGVFDDVAAVAVGQLTDARVADDDPAEAARRAAVISCLAPLGMPLITHLPVGHADASHAVPLGVAARLEEDGTLVTPAP